MLYDKRIQLSKIKNKGQGYVAKEKIPKGTVVLREWPVFEIPKNEEVVSEMFQIIYHMLHSVNKNLFMSLVPLTVEDSQYLEEDVREEFNRLKRMRKPLAKKIFNYIDENLEWDEIVLYGAKYICNAFEHNEKVAILIIGTRFNHSCLPNTVFGSEKDEIIFVTMKDIEKGDELCVNYMDITQNRKKRQEHLKHQYGFLCNCIRCTETIKKNQSKMTHEAVQIEKDRSERFG